MGEFDNPKEANGVWADDYLWLPSRVEIDFTWGLDDYQMTNINKSFNCDYWMRSGCVGGNSAYHVDILNSTFFTSRVKNVTGMLACRPALHLNLTKIFAGNEERTVNFESNGGSLCESETFDVGGRFSNLPVPTFENKYFAGWFLESELVTQVTSEIFVESGEPITLYAKWEDAGYTITYELDGGTLETLPNNIAIGTEFALQQPVKSGSKFAGWKILRGGHPPSKR